MSYQHPERETFIPDEVRYLTPVATEPSEPFDSSRVVYWIGLAGPFQKWDEAVHYARVAYPLANPDMIIEEVYS